MNGSAVRTRWRWLTPILLVVSGGFAAVAASFAPSTSVQAAARLETAPPGTLARGADAVPTTREVHYEWAETLRENEVAPVIVRLRDPGCAPASKEAVPSAASVSSSSRIASSVPDLTVTLTTVGFEEAPGSQRQIRLGGCEQFIQWDVVPKRAEDHQLAFRFDSVEGSIPLSPSRFRVAVAGPLLLPSSILHWGAMGFSGFSGVLGLAGLFTAVRQLGSRLFTRFRRAAPPAP